MRISVTGINFVYDNGYDSDATGVELHYVASGIKLISNDPVHISVQEYEENQSNLNGLRALIVDAKVEEANTYINTLNDYKGTVTTTTTEM